MTAHAEASFTDDDFYAALADLTTVPESTIRNTSFWTNWKYLDYLVYGSGTADLHVITKGSSETLRMECLTVRDLHMQLQVMQCTEQDWNRQIILVLTDGEFLHQVKKPTILKALSKQLISDTQQNDT